jgi:hypothetical protein
MSTQQVASAITTMAATSSTSRVQYATRIQNPYATPPLSPAQVESDTNAALVNIVCESHNSSLHSVTGSGVIIDPRGVILTNAHVAQYVLLSQDPSVGMTCAVRNGSPAMPKWRAQVLYIPQVWVAAHVAEVKTQIGTGNGEHDYALLAITGSTDVTTPLPAQFPYVAPDTREAIGFTGDDVLIAAYPAEWVGSVGPTASLVAAHSHSAIDQLLSFGSKTVDLLSMHGVWEAQQGSSGGAVVNAWGHIVGIITTTDQGTQIASRDLRATTVSYVDRDIKTQTGFDLQSMLDKNPISQADAFAQKVAPELIQLYRNELAKE